MSATVTVLSQPAGRQLSVLLALAARTRSNWPQRLSAAGHRIVLVRDAEAMLDALDMDACDLLLLDPALPGGVQAAKLYRFLSLAGRSVPIIGLTGPGQDADKWHEGVVSGLLPRIGSAQETAALRSIAGGSHAARPSIGCEVISIAARRAESRRLAP
jgi:CheY-like chemotaxis protein